MKNLAKSLIIILIIIFGMGITGERAAAVLPQRDSGLTILSNIDRTGWWWTETEVMSLESSGGSFAAEAAIDSENNIHLVWNDAEDYSGAGSDADISEFLQKQSAVFDTTESKQFAYDQVADLIRADGEKSSENNFLLQVRSCLGI